MAELNITQHWLLHHPGGSDGQEFASAAGDLGSTLGWEGPWRRAWQPT